MPLDRRPVASLWIGEELQYLNQLCLKSHLLHGHPVTLYCTDKLKNAPEGVEVRPASENWLTSSSSTLTLDDTSRDSCNCSSGAELS